MKAPSYIAYRDSGATLIEAGGGSVSDGLFVEQPGVLLLTDQYGQLTPRGRKLMEALNLYSEQDTERLVAEFVARLTYLSFPSNPDRDGSKSKKLHAFLEQNGHGSPYYVARMSPNVLVSGAAVETLFELVANKYQVGRTTSSRTDAMSAEHALYRTPGPSMFRNHLKQLLHAQLTANLTWRDGLDHHSTGLQGNKLATLARREFVNMAQPSNKAGHIVLAQNPEYYRQRLGWRLADFEGAELELRLLCVRIYSALQGVCPDIFPGRSDQSIEEQDSVIAEMVQVFGPTSRNMATQAVKRARMLHEQERGIDDVTIYDNSLPDIDPALLLFAHLALRKNLTSATI